jgi:glycosyltransferase involved in cell wall biosynthesis
VTGHPFVSLVVTVRDEAASIDALLESVASQTRPPDEVVIVDGGSRDGTWQRLEAWNARLPLRLHSAPHANIAQGRNLGVRQATHDLVAVTDAGVRLAPEWLERLLAASENADVVAGFFHADPRTPFETAMGATVLPDLDDVDPQRFLPSSRSILFRRAAWAQVRGYPEWLDYCEDLVFDLALKRAGYRFVFAPEAVAWFRPRGSVRAFFRQYYLYARGDGKADLWRTRHAIRYGVYVLATILASQVGRRWWPLALLLAGSAAYTRRSYQRLWPRLRGLRGSERVKALALVPLIRVVGDVAKMLGYPVGVARRPRHEPCVPSQAAVAG